MRPDGVLVMAGVMRAFADVAGFLRVGTLLLVWPWARVPVVVANKRTMMISFKVSLLRTAVNG